MGPMDQEQEFFERILSVEGTKLLWLLGSENGRKCSFWFDTPAELVGSIRSVGDSEYHVYFGVGSRKKALKADERGHREDYFQYKILWLDIDVLGPNHKSDRLPPSIDDAWKLVRRLPLKPSYVVASGGGLQAYWVLVEAVDAQEMDEFLPSWAATWKGYGEEFGWHIDSVFDLGRVMRAPGSVNRKNNVPVEILASSPKEYNLDDFEPYLRAPEVVQVVPREVGAPERPGDAYNRLHEPDAVSHAKEILEDYGFQAQRPKHNGEIPYVRPGKSTRDGLSAMVYPDGHTTIYSSDPSLPTTDADKVGKPLDPFGLYAMFVHEGDWQAATEDLRAKGFGDPLEENGWVFEDILNRALPSLEEPEEVAAPTSTSTWQTFNLFDLADAPEEDPPTVGYRDDNVCLLYAGKVHTVNGEPGGMKSWFCQVIVKQTVELGDNALIVDYENSLKSLYQRMRDLKVGGDDLKRIHVVSPSTPFGPAEKEAILALCAEYRFQIIVVDGTTDAFAAFGLDINSATDAARFDKQFLKVLASTGAAVIYVDHVTKDKEHRSSYGIGTQHKKSAIDGASFGVEAISSFGKGMHGRAKILLHKDKNGDLVQHAMDGIHTTMCELDMVSDPETNLIRAEIKAPSTEYNPNFRPTQFMGKISAYIQSNPGLSKDVIITTAGLGNAKREWVSAAFQFLEAEGYIAADLGDSKRDRRFRSIKPYDTFAEELDWRQTYGTPTDDPSTEDAMARVRKRMERDGSLEDARPPVDAPVRTSRISIDDL